MQVALHEAAVVKTDAERQAALQKQGMMRYSDWCTMWAHDVFTPSSCVHAVCSRHGTAERQTAAARQATSERAMNTVIEKKFRLFVRAMNTVIEKKFRLEMSSWREFITAAGEEGGVRPHCVSRAPCLSDGYSTRTESWVTLEFEKWYQHITEKPPEKSVPRTAVPVYNRETT